MSEFPYDPWKQGKTDQSVVRELGPDEDPLPGDHSHPINIEAYGGLLIAESIPPQYMPLILHAPEMYRVLKGLRDALSDRDQEGIERAHGWTLKVIAAIDAFRRDPSTHY